MNQNFYNSWILMKLALRRERIISFAWVVMSTLLIAGLAVGMYHAIDPQARVEMGAMFENPAMVAMIGPAYTLDAPGHFGVLYTTLMLLFTQIAIALMNIFLVVRHTRGDEEKGRYEVLRSLPIGRMSNLHAAMVTAVIINTGLSLVVGLGLFVAGDASFTFEGSLLWGASLGAVGLCFAGVAALFSQLSSSSRGAIGYSTTAVIAFYFLRVPADMDLDRLWLTFLSPFSLGLRTEAFLSNNWWPIGVLILLAGAMTLVAYHLSSIRDIDQGIIPDRPGRAHGGLLMKSPLGLTFRLTRNYVMWVILGMFLLGASYASILGDIDNFVAHNELYQGLILTPAGIDVTALEHLPSEQVVDMMRTIVAYAGFTITTLFASMVNSIMAVFGLAALIVLILKIKGEEKDTRAELIIATPVSKVNYLGGYALITAVTAVLMQVAMPLGLYLVGAAILPAGELPLAFVMEASLVFVPALWVMIGLTLFFIGLLPKYTLVMWGYYGYSFLILLIGRMGIFPEWVNYTTPFGFVPQLPMESTQLLPLMGLMVVAFILGAAGFIGYRKRNLNG